MNAAPEHRLNHRMSFAWMGLAVASILVAGALALVLVVGRAPGLNTVIKDPTLVKRCLVVHVDLALGVWFYAFLSALFALTPGRIRVTNVIGFAMAVVGVLLFVGSIFDVSATPVLSNYVPALDSNVFMIGIALFAGGVGLGFLSPSLFGLGKSLTAPDVSPAAAIGLRMSALIYLLAMPTFAAGWFHAQGDIPVDQKFEMAFWAGGHVLQFANEAAMCSVWLMILDRMLGRPVLSRTVTGILFLIHALPPIFAPGLAMMNAPRDTFTMMMQFGIWPVPSIIMLASIFAIAKGRGRISSRDFKSPAFVGFVTSVVMTLIGYGMGASIAFVDRETTLIPAHYHIAIGAVTAAYMGVSFSMLQKSGWKMPSEKLRRLAVWQPFLFGLGQTIFGFGLGIAGTLGSQERKVYGHEQHVRSGGELFGLSVMGIGGIIALAGGILFLLVLFRMWKATKPSKSHFESGT